MLGRMNSENKSYFCYIVKIGGGGRYKKKIQFSLLPDVKSWFLKGKHLSSEKNKAKKKKKKK